MFVPVTTKPYLNSANFIILQQGIPAFFLLIKEKVNKHITSREKVNGIRYVNNSDTSLYGIIRLMLQTYSDPWCPSGYAGHSLHSFSARVIDSTNKYYCTTFAIFESH
jgi:hypothetical protein